MILDNLIFRRVVKKDIGSILKLFQNIFGKKISKNFYNWRYHNKSYSAFVCVHKKKIIAHIGFVKYKLSKKKNYIYSRHSTFVTPQFQKKKIYYNLLKFSFEKLKRKTNFVIAWPNLINLKSSINHPNFKIINIYYLYSKVNFSKNNNNKNVFKKINKKFIKNLKFDQKNHLFFRDSHFLDWRYNQYKKKDFFYLDEEKLKNFIFQKKIIQNKIFYLIIDYYGKNNNYTKEIKSLIKILIYKKINFQFFISSKNRKLNSFLIKNKILKIKNHFFVGLYKLNRSNSYKKQIEKKIKDDIKISDTDVCMKTN